MPNLPSAELAFSWSIGIFLQTPLPGPGTVYIFPRDSEDQESRLGRCWRLTLPLALLAVYPAGLAATYADLVPYTWIGALLNGRKQCTAVK